MLSKSLHQKTTDLHRAGYSRLGLFCWNTNEECRPMDGIFQLNPAYSPDYKTVWRYKIWHSNTESKTPQDVLVYTDSPIFHKRTVIADLAADVTCGDVINPTTGAAYVAADADNCAVALQNQSRW